MQQTWLEHKSIFTKENITHRSCYFRPAKKHWRKCCLEPKKTNDCYYKTSTYSTATGTTSRFNRINGDFFLFFFLFYFIPSSCPAPPPALNLLLLPRPVLLPPSPLLHWKPLLLLLLLPRYYYFFLLPPLCKWTICDCPSPKPQQTPPSLPRPLLLLLLPLLILLLFPTKICCRCCCVCCSLAFPPKIQNSKKLSDTLTACSSSCN